MPHRSLPHHLSNLEENKSRLSHDMRALVEDIQSLLKSTADASGDGIEDLRHRLTDRLSVLRQNLDNVQQHAATHVRATMDCADHYVHERPWQAVAMGVAFGMLVGAMVAR